MVFNDQTRECVYPRPVGTRGGCGAGWGPCACPRRYSIRWGSVRQDGYTRTRTSTRPNTFQIGKKEGQADTGRPFLTYYRQKKIAWSRTERITSRCIGYATWSKLTR